MLNCEVTRSKAQIVFITGNKHWTWKIRAFLHPLPPDYLFFTSIESDCFNQWIVYLYFASNQFCCLFFEFFFHSLYFFLAKNKSWSRRMLKRDSTHFLCFVFWMHWIWVVQAERYSPTPPPHTHLSLIMGKLAASVQCCLNSLNIVKRTHFVVRWVTMSVATKRLKKKTKKNLLIYSHANLSQGILSTSLISSTNLQKRIVKYLQN